MIGIGPGARVMVATRPVDFRKGPDALAALVGAEYGGDPYSGVIYVFRAKRADRIKLVWWDGTGLCLMATLHDRQTVLERVAAIDLITDDLRNLALKVSANRRA